MTTLAEKRSDTVAVNQAVRALRAGCRPEQVVAHLATYCGFRMALPFARYLDPLVLANSWSDLEHDGGTGLPPSSYTRMDSSRVRGEVAAILTRDDQMLNPRTHRKPRRRPWSR